MAGEPYQATKAALGENQAEASPRAADEDQHDAALLCGLISLRAGERANFPSLYDVCQRAFACGADRAPDHSTARRVSGLGLQGDGEGRGVGQRALHCAGAGR